MQTANSSSFRHVVLLPLNFACLACTTMNWWTGNCSEYTQESQLLKRVEHSHVLAIGGLATLDDSTCLLSEPIIGYSNAFHSALCALCACVCVFMSVHVCVCVCVFVCVVETRGERCILCLHSSAVSSQVTQAKTASEETAHEYNLDHLCSL